MKNLPRRILHLKVLNHTILGRDVAKQKLG